MCVCDVCTSSQALNHVNGLAVMDTSIIVKLPSKVRERLDTFRKALQVRRDKEDARATQVRGAPPPAQPAAGALAEAVRVKGPDGATINTLSVEDATCQDAIQGVLADIQRGLKQKSEAAEREAMLEAADRQNIGEESKGRGGDVADPNRGKQILTEIEKFRLQEVRGGCVHLKLGGEHACVRVYVCVCVCVCVCS